MNKTEFITDRDIYKKVLLEQIPLTKEFLWIGTSDIKDLHVDKAGRMVPFLKVLASLVEKKISIRLIHAKEPGPAFREDFDRYPVLIKGMERILCPRVHFKSVIIDGKFAYTGSANLTGAGMGAKSIHRRNFEAGIITTDENLITPIMQQFDDVWMGKYCKKCQRKKYCSDYHDILTG
jgi:phosphatidylserine/phosphatidylglycerophosphate/cardiolipin synthase-like enzyme